MLRFDLPPVDANAYRLQAAVTFAISAMYLFSPFRWLALLLAVGGLVRGFWSPHHCPSMQFLAAFSRQLGLRKPVNAGAKMFADKLVAIAGSAMFVSWLMGSDIGEIPAYALLAFSLADLLTGFCAACWAYGLWYKLRPGSHA